MTLTLKQLLGTNTLIISFTAFHIDWFHFRTNWLLCIMLPDIFTSRFFARLLLDQF
jgi:hypothetical protein